MPTGDNPKSKENLKKGTPFTAETASEAGRRGATSPKRLNSISLRQKAQEELQKVVGKDKDGNPLTMTDAMIRVLTEEAIKNHNLKAWELLCNISGQKPVEKIMVADVSQETIDEVERAINDASTSD